MVPPDSDAGFAPPPAAAKVEPEREPEPPAATKVEPEPAKVPEPEPQRTVTPDDFPKVRRWRVTREWHGRLAGRPVTWAAGRIVREDGYNMGYLLSTDCPLKEIEPVSVTV